MRGIEQIPWLYDACCALIERFGLGRWRRWLVGGAAGRVLDVGCGTGRNLPLFDTGVRVVGLDPTRDALLAARRGAGRAAVNRLALQPTGTIGAWRCSLAGKS